jgi:hypothetical protein
MAEPKDRKLFLPHSIIHGPASGCSTKAGPNAYVLLQKIIWLNEKKCFRGWQKTDSRKNG